MKADDIIGTLSDKSLIPSLFLSCGWLFLGDRRFDTKLAKGKNVRVDITVKELANLKNIQIGINCK